MHKCFASCELFPNLSCSGGSSKVNRRYNALCFLTEAVWLSEAIRVLQRAIHWHHLPCLGKRESLNLVCCDSRKQAKSGLPLQLRFLGSRSRNLWDDASYRQGQHSRKLCRVCLRHSEQRYVSRDLWKVLLLYSGLKGP